MREERDSNWNKAEYMATLVACRWAGAIIEVSGEFGLEQHGQKNLKRLKSVTDQQIDGPRPKWGVESLSKRLKTPVNAKKAKCN